MYLQPFSVSISSSDQRFGRGGAYIFFMTPGGTLMPCCSASCVMPMTSEASSPFDRSILDLPVAAECMSMSLSSCTTYSQGRENIT